MPVYSSVYWGGTSGGPNDWGVRVDWDGNRSLGVPPVHRFLLMTHGQAAAVTLAEVLNRVKAIPAPTAKGD